MSTQTISGERIEAGARVGFRSHSLPITRDLAPACLSSLAIVALLVLVAGYGLLSPTRVYPTDEVMLAFLPVDAYHLLIGVPILLGCMALARRGRLVGLLCWPGALLYVLYSFILNLIGVPFGVLFLPYLLLVVFSAYTMVGIVGSIDGEAVRRRMAGSAPARGAGGVLIVLTGFFVLHAVAEIATALTAGTPVGSLNIMLWIADLSSISPACLIGGILLWRRKALGYVAGPGLLLAYSMLFFGLLPVLIYPTFIDGSPISVADLITMGLAGVLCAVLLALFVRGIRADRTTVS